MRRALALLVVATVLSSCGGAKLRGWNGASISILAQENARCADTIDKVAATIEEAAADGIDESDSESIQWAVTTVRGLAAAVNVYSLDAIERGILVVEDAGWAPEKGEIVIGSPEDSQKFNQLAGVTNSKVERRKWLGGAMGWVFEKTVGAVMKWIPWWAWAGIGCGALFFATTGWEKWKDIRHKRQRNEARDEAREAREASDAYREGVRRMIKVVSDKETDAEALRSRTAGTPVHDEFKSMQREGLLS